MARRLTLPGLPALPNVVGHGLGYAVRRGERTDEFARVVLVTTKLPKVMLARADRIPARIAGLPTDVREVGILRALQPPTGRWRPAPGGVSIGHRDITAGTLGAVVRDRATGRKLILSNNHVLADSNAGKIGDPILQPGPADGGRPLIDEFARLERFVPIDFGKGTSPGCLPELLAATGNLLLATVRHPSELRASAMEPSQLRIGPHAQPAANVADAAVATPLLDEDLRDDILGIGVVAGTKAAVLGASVRKSGRTTGLTTGWVELIDASVEVSYGAAGTAIFEQQLITSAMSEGGDSGSLLVDGEELVAVGLLFAGSDQVTIYNPIGRVLDELAVDL
jgi:hypothetical protein